MHKSDRSVVSVHMSFQETDLEDSDSSLSEEKSSAGDSDQMSLESESFDDEVTNQEVDSTSWIEIESDSDNEFLKNYGLVSDVNFGSDENTILPIDCYRHFITDEIIGLIVRETNRYAEQCIKTQTVRRRSNMCQWKPTTDEEILKFFGIIIEMELVQMPKLSYY
jgi:hypothetical protein